MPSPVIMMIVLILPSNSQLFSALRNLMKMKWRVVQIQEKWKEKITFGKKRHPIGSRKFPQPVKTPYHKVPKPRKEGWLGLVPCSHSQIWHLSCAFSHRRAGLTMISQPSSYLPWGPKRYCDSRAWNSPTLHMLFSVSHTVLETLADLLLGHHSLPSLLVISLFLIYIYIKAFHSLASCVRTRHWRLYKIKDLLCLGRHHVDRLHILFPTSMRRQGKMFI